MPPSASLAQMVTCLPQIASRSTSPMTLYHQWLRIYQVSANWHKLGSNKQFQNDNVITRLSTNYTEIRHHKKTVKSFLRNMSSYGSNDLISLTNHQLALQDHGSYECTAWSFYSTAFIGTHSTYLLSDGHAQLIRVAVHTPIYFTFPQTASHSSNNQVRCRVMSLTAIMLPLSPIFVIKKSINWRKSLLPLAQS